MARFFETKIIRGRVTVSLFTSEQMQSFAQAGLDHMIKRIQTPLDVNDTRARPLNANYAEQKKKGRYVALGGGQKYRGLPIRDWTLRGRTIKSMRVKRASQDIATIGPILQEAFIIMATRNKLDNMWGWSPADLEAVYAKISEVMQTQMIVRVQPGAPSGVAAA